MSYRTRCKAERCRAEIGMVQLASGRWHPVEALEPAEYSVWTERLDAEGAARDAGGTVRRLALIVGSAVIVFWQVTVQRPDRVQVLTGPCRVEGLESHFASCPAAEEFSRGRG